jgi:hypothetical protein
LISDLAIHISTSPTSIRCTRLAPYQIDPDGRHLKGKSNVADLQVGAAICRFDQGTPFLRARHAKFMDLQKAGAVSSLGAMRRSLIYIKTEARHSD